MSGHSKWAQIKHKKAASDAKKGQIFSKLGREIAVAARAGGPNPEANARLRSALERARSVGLPKENIERAIARAGAAADAENLSEFLYEATGPGGTAILIEGITDNKNRTLAEIRHLVAERGGRLAEQGSLAWNFERVGTLEVRKEDNPGKSPEELEIAFIDAGAKDFAALGDFWIVQTEFTRREEVRRTLEQAGVAVSESGQDYNPKNPFAAVPEDRAKIDPLLEMLADHPDVQEVYTNISESGIMN